MGIINNVNVVSRCTSRKRLSALFPLCLSVPVVLLTISITQISLRNHKTPKYQMARLARIILSSVLTSSESPANLVDWFRWSRRGRNERTDFQMNAGRFASGAFGAFILAVKQELKAHRISFHVFQRVNPQMLETGPCRHALGVTADQEEIKEQHMNSIYRRQ